MSQIKIGSLVSLFSLLLIFLSNALFAHVHGAQSHKIATHITASPTACINSNFTVTGSQYWKTITLKLTNNCGQAVDFQNAMISFQNANNLNTSFWGNFSPLSYPDNNLQITSQPQANGLYLASLTLHFPNYAGANSILPNNSYFSIIYGAPSADFLANTVNVYLNTSIGTGEIDLNNVSSKPLNVTQNYAIIHLMLNGQLITDAQVNWQSTAKISGLNAGTYNITPANVTDSNGNLFQGTANPASISLTSGQTAATNISYSAVPKAGIAFKAPPLPTEITGYTQNPSITLTSSNPSSSVTSDAPWNTTTTISGLANGSSYVFSSPNIIFNGYTCAPSFNPSSAIAATTAPVVTLNYACTPLVLDTITLNVQGLSATTSSINVVFQANNGASPISKTVMLTNGKGSATIQLADGVIYTISSTTVNGYTINYNPQPLTAKANISETITYTASSGNGRVIAYLPGWKTPPSVTDLVNAGYTHIIVAFGVFSTSNPGQITPAFDTVSANYIKSLQNAGIKVLLSLGGASTDIANTSVNFHQVLQLASSTQAFQQTFIQSLTNLITQYGFDGFDFDIESGLTAGGTFSSPQGDIAVLAAIINTLHTNFPSLLLTLAPQTANISATQNFNETWGNYSSLIMQTYSSLAWVGIQLYNSGCMLGIDDVCYDPNATSSPNFSVAMATDLLANWPDKTSSGQTTGFQHYLSNLTPSQIVLGYLIPNSQGQGDGSPIIPITTIKRAIQCLRTASAGTSSCDSYIPPKAYPGIGGVFGWEVTYDQNNQYAFAKGLNNCIVNNNCS